MVDLSNFNLLELAILIAVIVVVVKNL